MKRILLVAGAMLGCLTGFVTLLISAGAVMQQDVTNTVFTLSQAQADTQTAAEITFPCQVEGTDLIARQLVMYEGPYLEDGGDTPVCQITALVLYNAGTREVSQTEVLLEGEETLTFYASNIMPGAQVLVLEKSAAAWQDRVFTACTGWANILPDQALPEHALQISEIDMGTLSVTNLTQGTLTDIWLYYKNYLPEAELYVGGITYIANIESLEPGQTLQICPARYAKGYSRIFKAEAVG